MDRHLDIYKRNISNPAAKNLRKRNAKDTKLELKSLKVFKISSRTQGPQIGRLLEAVFARLSICRILCVDPGAQEPLTLPAGRGAPAQLPSRSPGPKWLY